jgi:hypothetical protein
VAVETAADLVQIALGLVLAEAGAGRGGVGVERELEGAGVVAGRSA